MRHFTLYLEALLASLAGGAAFYYTMHLPLMLSGPLLAVVVLGYLGWLLCWLYRKETS